jgi:hypothetical protein
MRETGQIQGQPGGHGIGLCGWLVSSDLELPELPKYGGPDDGPPIAITVSHADPCFPPARQITTLLDCGPDGECRLKIPTVATYLLYGGDRVVIRPDPAMTDDDCRLFLLGDVLALLCHQRGVLPLQGVCIRSGGEATLLCGPPGVGKSTLAMALAMRGYSIVCDDLAVVDCSGLRSQIPQPAQILPTVARLKLWSDSLEVLDIEADQCVRIGHDQERYFYPATSAVDVGRTVELRRVVALGEASDSSLSGGIMDHGAAARYLSDHIGQHRGGSAIRGVALDQVVDILIRHVEVVRAPTTLLSRFTPEELRRMVDRLQTVIQR